MRSQHDNDGSDAAEDPFAEAGSAGQEGEREFSDPQSTGEPDARPAVDGAHQELADQRERYLRLAAEYDNFRKRTIKERGEITARAQADILRSLLDALDDLGRFAHLDPAATDSATVVEGASMVEKKLFKVLAAAGLEVVNPQDQTFDPTDQEAVATEPALSREDDHMVAKVFQQGYKFNGQLLRPARVVVKQWNG